MQTTIDRTRMPDHITDLEVYRAAWAARGEADPVSAALDRLSPIHVFGFLLDDPHPPEQIAAWMQGSEPSRRLRQRVQAALDDLRGGVRHYTEEQCMWDRSLAYVTGVVTAPPRVREIHNPPSGRGLWRVRAAIVWACLGGAVIDRIVLEGSPSEEEMQAARERMERRLLETLSERSTNG